MSESTEKPAVKEAVGWEHGLCRNEPDIERVQFRGDDDRLLGTQGVEYFFSNLRRLVGAGENWRKFREAHPVTATEAYLMKSDVDFLSEHYAALKKEVLERATEAIEKDRRINSLERTNRTVSEACEKRVQEVPALRRQLDAVGKEKAEVERHAWKLDQDIIELVKDGVRAEDELERVGETICNQRERIESLKDKTLKQSELFFEQKKELEHIKDLEKQRNETIRNLTDKIQVLDGKLDDFQLAANPDFIEAMIRIAQGFRETKIDWSKVEKRIVLVDDSAPTEVNKVRIPPTGEELCNLGSILNDLVGALLKDAYRDPAPTEAEVEKVASKLYYEGYDLETPRPWEDCGCTTKNQYRRRARHVIEGGYRRKE